MLVFLLVHNTNIVSINFLGIHHLKSTKKIFYISEYWTQFHKCEINEFRWTLLIHRWFVNYFMSFYIRSCYGIKKKMLFLAHAQLASWELGINWQMHGTSNFQRIHFVVYNFKCFQHNVYICNNNKNNHKKSFLLQNYSRITVQSSLKICWCS